MATITGKSKKMTPHTKERAQDNALSASNLDMHRAMVAEAAYFLAERRGFAPGGALDDWLAAEVLIQRQLSNKT